MSPLKNASAIKNSELVKQPHRTVLVGGYLPSADSLIKLKKQTLVMYNSNSAVAW
jgi:hypothetical protein